VIRKNVGETKSEVRNRAAILEAIARPENAIAIKRADVFIKTVEVACHSRQPISE
jgi:hypothetical protein